MKTEAIRAYAAGILDGEGTISIYQAQLGHAGRRYSRLGITVGNTSEALLRFLQGHFKGSISRRRAITNRKPAYQWWLYGKRAQAFIREVLPFLVVNREAALLALEFPIQSPGRYLTPSQREKVRQLRRKMGLLNKRGPSPTQAPMELLDEGQLPLV